MKMSEMKNLKRNWCKKRGEKEQLNGECSGSCSSMNCFDFDDVTTPKGLDFICEEKCLGRRLTMGKDKEGCQITKHKKLKIYKDKLDGLHKISSDHLQRYRTEEKISVHRPLKVHHETVMDKESSSEIIEGSTKVTKDGRPQYRTEKTIYIRSPAVDHRESHQTKDKKVYLNTELEKSSESSSDESPQFRTVKEVKLHQPKIYHRRDIIESVSLKDKDTATEDKRDDAYIEEKGRLVHVKRPERSGSKTIRKISSKIKNLVEKLDPNKVRFKSEGSKESMSEEVYRVIKSPKDERKRFRTERKIYLQQPAIGRPQVEPDEDLRDGERDIYVTTSVPDKSFNDIKVVPTIHREVPIEESEAGQKDYSSMEEVELKPKIYIDEKPRYRANEYIHVQRPASQPLKDDEVSAMGKTTQPMAYVKDNGFYEEKEEPTTDRIRRYLSTKIMHLAERIQPTDEDQDEQVQRESVQEQPILYEEVEMAPKQSTGERPRFRTEDKIYLQYPATTSHQKDSTEETEDDGDLYGTDLVRSQAEPESQSTSVKFGESVDHPAKFDWKAKLHPIKNEDKANVSALQGQRHDWNVKLRPVEKIEKSTHPKPLQLDVELRPVQHKIKIDEQKKPLNVELRPVKLTPKDESTETKVYLKGKLSQVTSDKDGISSEPAPAYANYARKPMVIESTDLKEVVIDDDKITAPEYVIYSRPGDSASSSESSESGTDEPLYAEISQLDYAGRADPSVKATGKDIYLPKTYVDQLNSRQTFTGAIPKTRLTVKSRPILVKRDEIKQPKFEMTLDEIKEKPKKRVRILLPDNDRESQRQDPPKTKPWDVKLRPVAVKLREPDVKKYTHDWNVRLKPVTKPVVKAEEKRDISPHFGVKLRPVGIVKTDGNSDKQAENIEPPKAMYLVHDHNREVIYEPTNQVDVIQPQPGRPSLLSRVVRRISNVVAFWRPNEDDDTDARPVGWRDTSKTLPIYPSAPPPVQHRRGRGITPASHFGPEVYVRERSPRN